MSAPAHVLLVGGLVEDRSAIVAALGDRGCATDVADSPEDALAMLRDGDVAVAVVGEQASWVDADELVAELRSARPSLRIVLRAARPPVVGAVTVDPSDIAGLLAAVGPCPHASRTSTSASAVVTSRIDEIEAHWAELCRWDPAQPPHAEPAAARDVLLAVASALRQPQPLGWGLDPAFDDVIHVFADHVETPQQAIAQLACLRLALHDLVMPAVPEDERDETLARVSGVLDHAMMTSASLRTSRLGIEALTDALTGLSNRRAFDRDLEREVARAERTSSPLTLAVIDLDGLKAINDTDGHAAGDRALAAMGHALRATCRRSDRAYRIGGDEFAVLLTDALIVEPELLLSRLREAGAPSCTVGIASAPPDPLAGLYERADRALYQRRAVRRAGRA